jgi:hypothetical protein
MTRTWSPRPAVVLGVLLAASGCGSSESPPPSPAKGSIQVTSSTTGTNPDVDGYTVRLDGGTAQRIGANGPLALPDIATGAHSLTIGDIAGNCTLAQANPAPVTVVANEATAVALSVSCAATSGLIHVVVQTTGSTTDPDGYGLEDPQGTVRPIGINGDMTVMSPLGAATVSLTDVYPECVVTGPGNPAHVTVQADVTLELLLPVVCTAELHRIIFAMGNANELKIHSMKPDGREVTLVGEAGTSSDDTWPEYSPDRSRIIFTSNQSLGRDGVFAMNADGTNVTQLTAIVDTESYGQATWSPSGSQVAYVRNISGGAIGEAIVIANSNGSASHNLISGSSLGSPSWSPDGMHLVYEADYPSAIWTVDSNGSHAQQLTTPTLIARDFSPAWSPAGDKICFVRTADQGQRGRIWVMHADGTAPVLLPDTLSAVGSVRWSPDGAQLVAENNGAIWTLNADGTNAKRVATASLEAHPSWR